MKRSKVYGGEDRFHPAAGRGRDGGRGGLPQGRHLGCDVLELEEALWRSDAV